MLPFFGEHKIIIITLAASSGKRSVTSWRPLSVPLHTHRDSPGGIMRRGQRTFRPDNKEDRHISVFRLQQSMPCVYRCPAT